MDLTWLAVSGFIAFGVALGVLLEHWLLWWLLHRPLPRPRRKLPPPARLPHAGHLVQPGRVAAGSLQVPDLDTRVR